MRIAFLALVLFATIGANHAAPFKVPIEGTPGFVLTLDREYSGLELSATDPANKKNMRVFMFAPSDEQSSVIFSIGPDVEGDTEASIKAKDASAKVTKAEGRINKKKVQWLRWEDAKHLYSSCTVTLPDNAGTEHKISIWLIANTSERVAALEAAFSTIVFQ